jgi:hypothetical protein
MSSQKQISFGRRATVPKNADGKDASKEWKAKVQATIKRVLECNDDRNRLAHSLLQPNADGSVDLVRLKLNKGKVQGKDGVTWSRSDFTEKIQRVNMLAEELSALNGELRTFTYTISNLGWMPSSNFEPTMGMMRPRGISAVPVRLCLPADPSAAALCAPPVRCFQLGRLAAAIAFAASSEPHVAR